MSKRAIFMAADPVALAVLNYLRAEGENHGVCLAGVISQPERASGRGQRINKNPITIWAETAGLPVWTPEKPGEETLQWLNDQRTDLIFVMAYGHLLSRALLALPALGIFNFHTSLLPRYRGTSPIAAAIAAGDPETGVSLMHLVPKMDAGPVVDQQHVTIGHEDTEAILRARLGDACVPLISRNLQAIAAGTAQGTPQDECAVSYTRLLRKEDALLDFHAPASELAQRIRALTPWPGAQFTFQNTPIKIGQAHVVDRLHSAEAGTLLESNKHGIVVATSCGALLLKALQRPGGRMLPAADFLNGFPLPVGTVLSSHPMSPLWQNTPFPRPH